MDFAFSEEQLMLKDQARTWLKDKAPIDKVPEVADSEAGWDKAGWAEAASLGWVGLSVPEDQGGAGMTFLEDAVVIEEMGYGLYPGPYLSTEVLALPALEAGGRADDLIGSGKIGTLAYAEPGGPYSLADLGDLGTKAEADNGAWKLTGCKDLVTDLALADLIVVVASSADGTGLFLVERAGGEQAGVETRALEGLDGTRRLGRLTLSGAPAQPLVSPSDTPEVLARIRARALAAAALEATGIAQRALDLSTAYVSERKQFDKAIGTYQAVSHQLSNVFMETELARSLAYWAAWSVAGAEEGADIAVAAAKASAADAAITACERAIQVHGGIGFTWEHILHRLYKRARWLSSFEGTSVTHRKAVAASLF